MGLVGVTNVECLSVIDSSFLFPFRLLFFLSFPGVRSSCIFQCFICLLVFFFLKKLEKTTLKVCTFIFVLVSLCLQIRLLPREHSGCGLVLRCWGRFVPVL